jgi:hypothetical protein
MDRIKPHLRTGRNDDGGGEAKFTQGLRAPDLGGESREPTSEHRDERTGAKADKTQRLTRARARYGPQS